MGGDGVSPPRAGLRVQPWPKWHGLPQQHGPWLPAQPPGGVSAAFRALPLVCRWIILEREKPGTKHGGRTGEGAQGGEHPAQPWHSTHCHGPPMPEALPARHRSGGVSPRGHRARLWCGAGAPEKTPGSTTRCQAAPRVLAGVPTGPPCGAVPAVPAAASPGTGIRVSRPVGRRRLWLRAGAGGAARSGPSPVPTHWGGQGGSRRPGTPGTAQRCGSGDVEGRQQEEEQEQEREQEPEPEWEREREREQDQEREQREWERQQEQISPSDPARSPQAPPGSCPRPLPGSRCCPPPRSLAASPRHRLPRFN